MLSVATGKCRSFLTLRSYYSSKYRFWKSVHVFLLSDMAVLFPSFLSVIFMLAKKRENGCSNFFSAQLLFSIVYKWTTINEKGLGAYPRGILRCINAFFLPLEHAAWWCVQQMLKAFAARLSSLLWKTWCYHHSGARGALKGLSSLSNRVCNRP